MKADQFTFASSGALLCVAVALTGLTWQSPAGVCFAYVTITLLGAKRISSRHKDRITTDFTYFIAITYSIIVVAKYSFLAPAPWGNSFSIYVYGILTMIMAAVITLVFFAGLLLSGFDNKNKKQWMNIAGLALVSGLYLAFTSMCGTAIQSRACYNFAERLQPLVASVDAYKRDHNELPKKLEDLVPEYLKTLPSTGIGILPDYDLRRVRDSWQLVVSDPNANAEFVYLPDPPLPAFDSRETWSDGHWKFHANWITVGL